MQKSMVTEQQSEFDRKLESLEEWQSKQYVEGYYTGRRALDFPFLHGKRPNRWGYGLLLLGMLMLVGVALTGWSMLTVDGPSPSGTELFTLFSLLVLFLLAMLITVSGYRLLRPR